VPVTLEDLLKKKRIVVCCGSGGVGKTTIAATLGMQAALYGKKVLTFTIDPAKRLANALGMSMVGNEEVAVPEEKFLAEGLSPTAKLYAMMLDTKYTFDELIKRYAPSEEIKASILSNPFYQQLSSAMAGSHEYLAMEKLYQIYLRGTYDLIVVDTPPTKHAMDFLEAPIKIRGFFNRNISGWFLKPYLAAGKLGFHVFNRTVATVVKMIRSVTGAEFLKEVSEFVMGLSQAFDIFRSRAEEVTYVLKGEATAFVLVTSPSAAALEEAYFFFEKLREASLPFGGFLINCVHTDTDAPAGELGGENGQGLDRREGGGADPGEQRAALIESLRTRCGISRELATALVDNYLSLRHLAEADSREIGAFVKRLPEGVPVKTIPYLDDEVYDFKGLKRVAGALFGEEVPATAPGGR